MRLHSDREWRRRCAVAQVALEAACLCVVGLWCSQRWPVQDVLTIVLALAVAYAVPRGVLARTQGGGPRANFVLMAVGMLLIVAAVDGIWHSTALAGRPLTWPRLMSDDGGYYYWAVHTLLGDEPGFTRRLPFIGFPLLMLVTFKVMGVSVVWPVAMNMCFTLLAIVLTALAGVRVMRGRVQASASTVMCLVMGGCGLLFYFLSQGVAVLKEASCYLAISLVAYALGRMCTEGRTRTALWTDVLLYGLGMALLCMTRLTMSYFVLAGVLVCMLIEPRRNWRLGTVLLALGVIIYGLCWLTTYNYGMDRQLRIVAGEGAMPALYITQEPYKAIIGDYFNYTVLHRILLLPVTCGVQAIIPFPWFMPGVPCDSVGAVLARTGWTWYAILGIACYYYIFLSFRREGRGLGLWALWPLLCFMGVAYVTGGSLSRYVLPFEPLMVIVAVFTLLSVHERHGRTSLLRWMAAWAIVLVAVLLVCYNVQSSYY